MKGHEHDIPSSVFPDNHNLAVLGHELGNVLNGLLGMTELLGDSGLTQEQSRWLRAIEYSGRQMESLIRSVWTCEKAPAPEKIAHRVHMNGMELLEQIITSHTPAARSRGNRLLLVTHPDVPRYWRLDACLVRQLLDNLVGNAIKFTRAGEVVVDVASVPVDDQPAEALRFRVSDTGPGIDASDAEHFFGAYRQGTAPQEAGAGNRGLGLYVCRNIARSLRGQITCSSPEVGGSVFEVILPGVLDGADADPLAFRSTLLEPVRCQLLLADELRCSVANFLHRLGVQFTDRESALPGQGLTLLISEAPQQTNMAPTSLLLTPSPCSGPVPQRILEMPVLESNLGCLLLEMALEWRGHAIRNESPDSTPTRR